jgi:hypothetical protein
VLDPALSEQLRGLLAEAGPNTVPGGRLAGWGPTTFPDGGADAPVVTQPLWQLWYGRLEDATLRNPRSGDSGASDSNPGHSDPRAGTLMPLTRIQQGLARFRPDGVMPIAVVDVEVAVPRPEVAAAIVAAAASGAGLSPPPAGISDAIQPARCCMAAGLLHDQWGFSQPAYRGRTVTWLIDPDLWQSDGEAVPKEVVVDAGDGRGPRTVAVGEPFEAGYAGVAAPVVSLAVGPRTARFSVSLSDAPAAPPPDDTWTLVSGSGPGDEERWTGKAYVYRAQGHSDVEHGVIIAEGFPGGFTADYLYDVVNQNGMLEGLRGNGFDVILLSFDRGTDRMEYNAGVVEACIHEATSRSDQPLVVGGMSMGGLITRYALAAMEQRGEDHHTHLFVTIDTPHTGANTSLAAQWFVQSFRRSSSALGSLASLLDSPANQQFVMTWVHDGVAAESPLRTEWLRLLAGVGDYPQRPRRVAVSSGRGDGARSFPPGAPVMEWSGTSFASASLAALPEGSETTVGQGWWFPDPPALPLHVASLWSWDGAPGGQAPYNGIAAAVASSTGCGTVTHSADVSCSVPTVSALALDQGPFEPVTASSRTPFHAVQFSAQNQLHLTLEPELSAWLLAQIGTPTSAQA